MEPLDLPVFSYLSVNEWKLPLSRLYLGSEVGLSSVNIWMGDHLKPHDYK